jgi:uncharacterized protein (UPF0371 family)
MEEEIRGNYPEVDIDFRQEDISEGFTKKSDETILKLTLTSNVKKIFLKASLRVEKFKQEAPSLSLPPKPVVLTRWGTWLDVLL